MERLLLLTMFFDQKTCSMDGVRRATPRYKSTLIGGQIDDVLNTTVEYMFKNCKTGVRPVGDSSSQRGCLCLFKSESS
ncbi:hypothetical protein Y032_0401g775 [Ancylostoma ceylanicum]|uniref:Uncharacterized protein n=1 Tax=Ancylostoma ceylanicum TaxID=53326 RepID=A0A016X320_9BILA|nr:hypothetical protein Y032_0401g775 [Ancylostoma ceylanicum]